MTENDEFPNLVALLANGISDTHSLFIADREEELFPETLTIETPDGEEYYLYQMFGCSGGEIAWEILLANDECTVTNAAPIAELEPF